MMSLPHTVTIIHPGDGTDSYGATIDDWGTAATDTGVAAWVQPGRSVRDVDDRAAITADKTCFLDPTATVGPRDRIQHDDDTYEIIGAPALLETPRGPHHWELDLRLVTVVPIGSET